VLKFLPFSVSGSILLKPVQISKITVLTNYKDFISETLMKWKWKPMKQFDFISIFFVSESEKIINKEKRKIKSCYYMREMHWHGQRSMKHCRYNTVKRCHDVMKKTTETAEGREEQSLSVSSWIIFVFCFFIK
jgi:hypothetical protein